MQAESYAKNTFDEVATHYDEIPFFKISAQYLTQIVKREKEGVIDVLDVACGTGNVTLECAKEMPESSFEGFDISEGMLTKARANVKALSLSNVDFHLQDITKLQSLKKYDVITCAYALFFLPNPQNVLSTLLASLKPEGRVIFTSFLPKAFMPSVKILLPLLIAKGSAAAKAYDVDKWENLKHIDDIDHLCQLAGSKNYNIVSKVIRYDMDVDAWWELMNNTGFKGMLMELDDEGFDLVKKAYYEAMVTYADVYGDVELNADSYFVTVKA